MLSNSDVRLEDWKVGRSRLGALSIRPKNSGLKFQNFMWRMEQYFQEISRLVAPAWLDRTVPFTLGRKFPEMQDRQVLETAGNLSNSTEIYDQTGPTEKKGSTSNGGPSIPKIFRLDRTDPFSFGPKFPDILVK